MRASNGYIIDFVVQGRGAFPFDMLRYDQCWPQGGEDVTELHIEDCSKAVRRTRAIKLRMFSGNMVGPTTGRWESFGWKVIEINGEVPL